jgi:hypothetical protein
VPTSTASHTLSPVNGSVFDCVDPPADAVLVVVLDEVAVGVAVPDELEVLAVGVDGAGVDAGVVVVPGLCVVVELWWFDSGSMYC